MGNLLDFSVSIKTTGPLFDGSAKRALIHYADEIGMRLAAFATVLLKQRTIVFKNPTGTYRSKITWDRRGDTRVVHDQGIVYGPWLEGISRRNDTTRFKGYHLFRRSVQDVEAEIPRIVASVWPSYASRFGGS